MTDDTKRVPPLIAYEQLEKDFKEKHGIDLGDVIGHDAHFDAWHAAKGLPEQDDEGTDKGASSIFWTQYEEDPEGEEAAPAAVNFWHWLLNAFEFIPWKEHDGHREKDVPVMDGMVVLSEDPTDESLAQDRARMEAQTGDLPDELWKGLEAEIRQEPLRTRKIAEIVKQIVDDHGGPIRIQMKVSR